MACPPAPASTSHSRALQPEGDSQIVQADRLYWSPISLSQWLFTYYHNSISPCLLHWVTKVPDSRNRHFLPSFPTPVGWEHVCSPEYYSLTTTSLAELIWSISLAAHSLQVCKFTRRFCTAHHTQGQQESGTCWEISGRHWEDEIFLWNNKEGLEELAQR